MKISSIKPIALLSLTLFVSGCASYRITEQEMTDYLHEHVQLEQTIGIKNVMHAAIAVDDLKVNIGRVDKDRISVFASTNAKVQMLSSKELGLDLDIEFSAIPYYDAEQGEVFIKSLRLEKLEERSHLLTPEITQFLKPAVSMIGQALSNQPVYRLDSSKVQHSLLKSTNPNLVIKNNTLVIELFD